MAFELWRTVRLITTSGRRVSDGAETLDDDRQHPRQEVCRHSRPMPDPARRWLAHRIAELHRDPLNVVPSDDHCALHGSSPKNHPGSAGGYAQRWEAGCEPHHTFGEVSDHTRQQHWLIIICAASTNLSDREMSSRITRRCVYCPQGTWNDRLAVTPIRPCDRWNETPDGRRFEWLGEFGGGFSAAVLFYFC